MACAPRVRHRHRPQHPRAHLHATNDTDITIFQRIMENTPPSHTTHPFPSKLPLTPSTPVYLDYSSLASPTPSTSVASTPSPTAEVDHDFFAWRHANPAPDPSDSAPTPPDNAPLGAWYAFENGLNSALGNVVFADEAAAVAREQRDERVQAGLPAMARRRVRRRDPIGGLGAPPRTGSERMVCPAALHGVAGVGGADVAGQMYNRDEEEWESEEEDDGQSEEEEMEDSGWVRRAGTFIARFRTAAENAQANEDITAEQAANGMDVQGIPWESLPVSRADYRATRLRENSRKDSPDFLEGLRDVLKEPRRGGKFYDFFRNTRKVKCSIVHFQLRNLAWATSKHDVFVMHDAAVIHWDAAARRKSPVLDLSGSGTASGLGMVQISTMIAKDDLVIAGGFYGEMVAKNLKSGAIIHNKRITYDENAITNAIDIFEDSIMTSNNDCYVRCFDMHTFVKKASFRFNTPVNHATRQPGGKMVAVAGDDKPIQVIDGDSGDRIAQLHGHEHFSFATGWHPNGRMFATGSQDRMCRVWDVRNMSQSFSVLGAHVGAVRSLRFTSCGRFLVMAEPRDFVHIFDVNRGEFDTCQEIDLFGEIAGIALTPSAEGLFIAVNDRTYSSLLEYERRTSSHMSDLIF